MIALLPRSLFGRNLLLIIALIFAAEFGITILFRQLIQEPRAARMAEVAQLQVVALRTTLQLTTPSQRNALLHDLGQHDPDHIAVRRITAPGQAPLEFVTPPRGTISLFMQRMQERLGPDYRLGWQESPKRRLWIGTRIDDADYWFGIDSGIFVESATSLFVMFAVGAGLLALLGAYLIQRRVNHPLHALANAAAQIGRGQVQAISLEGLPIEIAQVATSFNQMASALETAERERALMLAGVSHDLRTPLAKLRLATEILAEGSEPELIAGMVRNIGTADAIIGQFIDFARVGNDEALQLCELNELVSDLAATADRKLVKLELGKLSPLTCRPLALRRAIANLLENALRHGGDNSNDTAGPPVTMRTEQDSNQVCISIRDHGNGIPPQDMERLRQPFTRLEAARNGQSGAGLGLAIVERIARMHQGQLLLINHPDGGLVASIVLPLG
jgi:two-component system osmolarity sensor histidine kinase EnvZ